MFEHAASHVSRHTLFVSTCRHNERDQTGKELRAWAVKVYGIRAVGDSLIVDIEGRLQG